MISDLEVPVIARFTFKPSRAQDFLEDDRLVSQVNFATVEEVMTCVEEFGDAIEDCNVIVNGKQVNLSDFLE